MNTSDGNKLINKSLVISIRSDNRKGSSILLDTLLVFSKQWGILRWECVVLDNGHRTSNEGSPVSSSKISPLLIGRILTVVLVVHDSDQKTEISEQTVI